MKIQKELNMTHQSDEAKTPTGENDSNMKFLSIILKHNKI